MALIIHEAVGAEGRLEIAGLRAVVGVTSWWKLTRRGTFSSGEPRWRFRAAFSYLKEELVGDPDLKTQLLIKYGRTWFRCEPLGELKWEGSNLEIEEMRLWPNE